MLWGYQVLSVAVHSEYENLMPLLNFCFHFQKLRGKDRQKDGGREKNGRWGGGREGGRERVCCLVVWSRVSVRELHLHASVPSSFLLPGSQSLLWPVSRKCPPSWHTHTHTHTHITLKCWQNAPPPRQCPPKMQTFHSACELKGIPVCLNSILEEGLNEQRMTFKLLWGLNKLSNVSFGRWCSFVSRARSCQPSFSKLVAEQGYVGVCLSHMSNTENILWEVCWK